MTAWHLLAPRVTPPPELGDIVRIRLPGGFIGQATLVGRLYASDTPFEVRLPDDKLVYVGAGDIERW